MNAPVLLELRDVSIDFATARGTVQAVVGVSLDVAEGECLAIVGESGSGKTQLVLACLGLLAANARIDGSIRFDGRELVGAGESVLDAVRGAGLAFVAQDPMNALTPHLRIGRQLAECLLDRGLATPVEARRRAREALRAVEIDDPEARLDQYPHELSGGMRQRVALAIALMLGPRLLIADEPTTALDVTVQARILTVLHRLRTRGLTIVLITHDLGVVAGLADRVAVMYAGRIVENGRVEAIFAGPRHPYTSALLAAVPRLDAPAAGPLAGIDGAPPRPGTTAEGCAFAPRCGRASDLCRSRTPVPVEASAGVRVACHHPLGTETPR